MNWNSWCLSKTLNKSIYCFCQPVGHIYIVMNPRNHFCKQTTLASYWRHSGNANFPLKADRSEISSAYQTKYLNQETTLPDGTANSTILQLRSSACRHTAQSSQHRQAAQPKVYQLPTQHAHTPYSVSLTVGRDMLISIQGVDSTSRVLPEWEMMYSMREIVIYKRVCKSVAYYYYSTIDLEKQHTCALLVKR